jgi:hypothetical protein
MTRTTLWLNLLGFQLLWGVAVRGAARGGGPATMWLALGLAGWHLHQARQPGRELRLLALVTLLGGLSDALLLRSGVLHFAAADLGPACPPSWMLALWLGFATSLNVSLRWMQGHPVWAALLGAVGGVASYAGGARLGAATLLAPVTALVLVALCWAALMPLFMWLARRLDGFAPGDGVVNS